MGVQWFFGGLAAAEDPVVTRCSGVNCSRIVHKAASKIRDRVVHRPDPGVHQAVVPVVTTVIGVGWLWLMPASLVEEPRDGHVPSGDNRSILCRAMPWR